MNEENRWAKVAENVGRVLNPLGWAQHDEDQRRYETQLEREDTAYVRAVNDLAAAGLSKGFAVGKPAQSSRPGAAPKKPRSMEHMMMLANLVQQKANIAKTAADAALVWSQKKRTDIDIEYQKNAVPMLLGKLEAERQFAERSLEDRLRIEANRVENLAAQSQYYLSSAEVNAIKANLSGIDLTWKRELQSYVKERLDLDNPLIVDYMTGYLVKAIKEESFEIWKELGVPMEGGSQWNLLGGLSSTSGQILKEIGKAIGNAIDNIKGDVSAW